MNGETVDVVVFWDLANAGLALGGTVACLLALLLGMQFVKVLS